jgi:hypothetical protein
MTRPSFFFVFAALLGAACSSSSPPADGGGGDAQNNADGAADVVATDTAAAACKHAGDTCTPNDTCNTWSCKCANISSPELTVGSCSGGTCTSGNDSCASLCANAGGVTSATDDGC